METLNDERIDLLLKKMYELDNSTQKRPFEEVYRNLFGDNVSTQLYISELVGLGLISPTGTSEMMFKITPFGRKVYSEGGWIAYSKKEKDKEERDLRLRELEVTATVSAAESSKKSNRAAWIASIVAALAFLLSGKQYLDGQSDKTEYLKQVESLQKSMKAYEQELKVLKKSMADSKLNAVPIKAK